MGTETRIGIVTGLVIVVVASVYFFISHQSGEEPLFLTEGGGQSPPPSIPPSRPSSPVRTQPKPHTAAKDADGSPTTPRINRFASRPNGKSPGAGYQALQRPTIARPNRGPHNNALATNSPAVRPDVGGNAAPPLPGTVLQPRQGASTGNPSSDVVAAPIPLRTGASPSLVDATQRNLDRPGAGRVLDFPGDGPTDGRAAALSSDDVPIDPDFRKSFDQGDDAESSLVSSSRGHEPSSTPTPGSADRPAGHPNDSANANSANSPGMISPSASDRQAMTTGRKAAETFGAGQEAPVSAATGRTETVNLDWPKRHEVVEDETLFAIAQHYYGDGSAWGDLLKANPSLGDPKRLRVGMVLSIPAPEIRKNGSVSPIGDESDSVRPAQASSPAGRTYRVQPGDTFQGIATAVYGDWSRWEAIFQRNRGLVDGEPRRLRPGMILILP